jgi:hypothetical protein
VNAQFELVQYIQPTIVVFLDTLNPKDVLRADLDAIALALAALQAHDRPEHTCRLFAAIDRFPCHALPHLDDADRF